MNEYTVELEARTLARSADALGRPPIPDRDDVSALLSEIEADGRFLGPVLSVSEDDGSVRVLGQIKAVHVNEALRIGQMAYRLAFVKIFGELAWVVLAAAPFSPDQPVESIPTPV